VLCCWLTGLGDLQLAPDFLQHQVKQMTWNNMTLDAADAKFKKLMKDNGTLCAKYCGACTYDFGAGVSIISARLHIML